MSNKYEGLGNLGQDPTLTYIKRGDKEIPKMEASFYVQRKVPDGEGGFKEKYGYWVNIEMWNRRAEATAEVLKKGMRVFVQGELEHQRWTDKETDEPRSSLVVHATLITIDPYSLLGAEESEEEQPSPPAKKGGYAKRKG